MNNLADCQCCPRLAAHLAEIRAAYPGYYARPVPAFGADSARLLIIGLAPGLHGANATGRPFTGDYAGILLYQTLYDYGFSNQPQVSSRDDGLILYDCRVTNAVKCLPPANKPTGEEIRHCNGYLRTELAALPQRALILALGTVAHRAVLGALALKPRDYPFGHAAGYTLGEGRRLLLSYHCSRYNTQTKRLTPAMFQSVFAQARHWLEEN